MSKQVVFTSVQPDPEGPIFGRVFDPTQFANMQSYVGAHIHQVVKDLLVAGAAGAQVAGFGATLTTGLNVSVAVGGAVDVNGLSYEAPAAVVAMAAAHATLARIDLIVATLEVNAEAETEFVQFKRVRTQAEREADLDPYPPTQFNVPTELHTRATISVKTGTPNASPVAPTASAGEVALWQVHVTANQVTLGGGDLTDVRVLMRSLYQIKQDLAALTTLVNTGLSEIVEDIVGGGFVTASTTIVFTYDDASNHFTLNLHPTYKAMLDDATSSATASKIMKRDASGDCDAHKFRAVQTANGARPTMLVLENLGTGTGTGSAIEFKEGGGDLVAKLVMDYNVQAGGPASEGCFRFYSGAFPGHVLAEILRVDYHSPQASVFGNLAVSGLMSKGGGSFLIDHPLDPDNKDLAHGFVEAPRYELIYRNRVQLVDGEAEVDIDVASGMTPGTFAALTQNVQFLQPYAETGWDKVRIQDSSFDGSSFVIECENGASSVWVSWGLIAERNDAFILAGGETDSGHLIVERDKLEGNLGLLAPETRSVPGATPGVIEEVVQELVGTVGFPRHAAVVGEGEIPTKEVTITT